MTPTDVPAWLWIIGVGMIVFACAGWAIDRLDNYLNGRDRESGSSHANLSHLRPDRRTSARMPQRKGRPESRPQIPHASKEIR